MKRTSLLFTVLVIPAFIFAQNVEEKNTLDKHYVIGDFNNDGYADDIAHFNKGNIEIFNSSGTSFYKNDALSWKSKDFETAKTNGKLVAGDFDNDGYIDDIAAIYEVGVDQAKIFTWINTQGQFEKQSWWYGPDFNANQVFNTMVSGDFDNDGFVDDIAAFYDYQNYTTKVFVWKSNAKKFSWPSTMWYGGDFDASRLQGTLISGDFDQDGFIDDLAGFYNYVDNSTKVFIWESNKRTFVWPRTAYYNENVDVDQMMNHIVSGDFDRDGFVDDIVTFEKTNTTEALARTWNIQNFRLKTSNVLGEFNGAQHFLLAGDFNKDKVVAEILHVDDKSLFVYKAEEDYMYYPENWLTLKSDSNQEEIQENTLLTEIQPAIFPTVSSDIININFTTTQTGSIALFDMLGKQVYKQDFSAATNSIHVNDMAKGTYILAIRAAEKTFKEKITIQ